MKKEWLLEAGIVLRAAVDLQQITEAVFASRQHEKAIRTDLPLHLTLACFVGDLVGM